MSESKQDMMSAIRELNPSAGQEFLDEFSAEELRAYLRRLHSLPLPRRDLLHRYGGDVYATAPPSPSPAGH